MHRLAVSTGAVIALTMVTLGTACTSNETSTPEAQDVVVEEVVDDDAIEILRSAATLLRSADSLEVVARTGFDVVQSDGQRIEFGATRKMAIQRPDRARFEFLRRDGKEGVVVLDGSDIWVHSPTHGVYATTSQPGGIDASIEHMTEELGITAPLADLVTADVGSTLAEGLRSCYVVGDSTIGGTACHHVAVRNDYADFQMWIAKGTRPLLQRMVITYREEPGQPQFWAEFSDWRIGSVADSRLFVFDPPAGAERINLQSIHQDADAASEERE